MRRDQREKTSHPAPSQRRFRDHYCRVNRGCIESGASSTSSPQSLLRLARSQWSGACAATAPKMQRITTICSNAFCVLQCPQPFVSLHDVDAVNTFSVDTGTSQILWHRHRMALTRGLMASACSRKWARSCARSKLPLKFAVRFSLLRSRQLLDRPFELQRNR